MAQPTLEARIKKLEDIEAIKKLMFNYTYWLDYGEMDKALDCFSDNAKIDIRMRGGAEEGKDSFELSCEGREEINRFYSLIIHEKNRFSASHLILNPVVEVNGDAATGIFYLLEPTAIARAMWGHGRYDIEFVRIKGIWRISLFAFLWNFNTPYDEGWSKIPMAIL
jgi:hypothetical protein